MLLLTNCSSENSDWKNAKMQNTVQAYEQFISKHPQSLIKDSASFKIEELSFKASVMKNSINDYNDFIKQFPKSIFIDSAKNKILNINLLAAISSKNIVQIIDIINNNPNNQIVNDLLVNSKRNIEIKNKQIINDECTIVIKNSKNEKNLSIELKIPPKKRFNTNSFFDKSNIINKGEIITVFSIKNHEIDGVDHQESGKDGLTFAKDISKENILPISSEYFILTKNVIFKINDYELLYSTSDETKFQRIEKTNTYKLIVGKAYNIKLY